MEANLKNEFQYYINHQKELVKKHKDKYVVIVNLKVIGVYDSETEAIDETSKIHKLGTFLVQKCEPGEDSYTQTYHSRVVFS